jgi:uncharacterized protein (DUF2141 family)
MRVNFKLTYLVGVIVVLLGLSLPLTARSSVHLAAETPVTFTVTIKVIGARNAKGKLGVALFQDAKGFPEDNSKALRQQEADINPQTLSAQIVFRDVPQGVYAVSVRHDENNNGKLDRNFIGVPKEGYGASNNPKKKLRSPSFDEAKFSLNAAEQAIEIKLIY